jgi:hypothetical protein
MNLAAFPNTIPDNAVKSSQQLGALVLRALQHQSPEEYVALFPSLDDFSALMQENSSVYGTTLEEARRDFTSTYLQTLIPGVKERFAGLLAEGQVKGVDWSKVQLATIETEHAAGSLLATITIQFTSQGKKFSLVINRAFVLGDQWKAGQSLTLAEK